MLKGLLYKYFSLIRKSKNKHRQTSFRFQHQDINNKSINSFFHFNQ